MPLDYTTSTSRYPGTNCTSPVIARRGMRLQSSRPVSARLRNMARNRCSPIVIVAMISRNVRYPSSGAGDGALSAAINLSWSVVIVSPICERRRPE